MPTYKFVGKGFIPGIPSRDLTSEEAEKYGKVLSELSGQSLTETGLWEAQGSPKKKAEATVSDSGSGG